MFKISDVAKNAAVATFKKDRSTIKGKITAVYNRTREVINEEGSADQVKSGLATAKQHLGDLEDCLAKVRSYLDPGLPADKEVITEAEAYCQPSGGQVQDLGARVQAYVKYTTRLENFSLSKQHNDQLMKALKKKLTEKAGKEDIERASKKLEEYQVDAKATLTKLQDETRDVARLGELHKWQKENHARVEKALEAAEEHLEELGKQDGKDVEAKKVLRQLRLDAVVDCSKELAALVARTASKPKLRRARQNGETARQDFKDAHRAFLSYVDPSRRHEIEADFVGVTGELDRALCDVTVMLDGRIDESSDTTSVKGQQEATRLEDLRRQQRDMDAAIHADIDRKRREQVDRDQQMAENLQRKFNEGQTLRDHRAIEKARADAELDAADKALDGLRILMGSTGGSQQGDEYPPGLPQPTPPMVTEAAMAVSKVARTATYCSNAVKPRGNWILELQAKGNTTVDPMYKGFQGSIKAELDVFDGNADKWDNWSRNFEGLVHNTGMHEGQRLTLLKKYMRKPSFLEMRLHTPLWRIFTTTSQP
ncbi:unnamed protein product [Sphagnum tenellum]